MAKKSKATCDRMKDDFQRIGSVAGNMAQGSFIRGTILGPPDKEIWYDISCGINRRDFVASAG